ncbi:hypothetical protein DOY81_004890 [Sarcophaga bullata]|nr:hypothetical protein DOY81_004890 [Sarcophaga bullata]
MLKDFLNILKDSVEMHSKTPIQLVTNEFLPENCEVLGYKCP